MRIIKQLAKINLQKLHRQRILGWLVANLIGHLVSIIISLILSLTLFYGDPAIKVAIVFAVLQGAITGLTLGFSQLYVLSQYLNRKSSNWILATTIGYSISNPISMFFIYKGLLTDRYLLLDTLATAMLVSFFQWLFVLRINTPQSYWWVLSHLINWCVCTLINLIIPDSAYLFTLVVCYLISNIITGATLNHLLPDYNHYVKG